jgi:DnaJ-domain-containing protein 1
VSGRERPLVAFGDPQASFDALAGVLSRAGLLAGPLSSSGLPSLAAHTRLLSIGDHFDWGAPSERSDVADSAERMLQWLASHDAEQVVLLAGNHDLARVGELLPFVDDAHFAAVQALADRHYYGTQHSPDDEAAFFRACTWLPTTEVVARDMASFRVSQRRLVADLLRARRLRLAHAENGLLFTHAGITRKALERLGVDERADAATIANALNAALDDAVDDCLGGQRLRPLVIPGLHRPGDALGEGDGVLYHRPTHVADDAWLEPRRFDPRRLPRGLWQVVGHVADKRCVTALKPWSLQPEYRNGVLRHLIVKGGKVTYDHGLPPPRDTVDPDAAVMIFIDGAMHATTSARDPATGEHPRYELLDTAAVAVR